MISYNENSLLTNTFSGTDLFVINGFNCTPKQSDDNKSTTSAKSIDPRYGTLDSQLSLSLKIREPSNSSVDMSSHGPPNHK
jgi:hypothetical protein